MKKTATIISLLVALQFSCFAQVYEYVVVTVSPVNGTTYYYAKEKPRVELKLSAYVDSTQYNTHEQYFKTTIVVMEYMDKIGYELISTNPSEFFFRKRKNK